LFGRSFRKATLYPAPEELDTSRAGATKPVVLRMRSTSGGIAVSVPELRLWGVILLE